MGGQSLQFTPPVLDWVSRVGLGDLLVPDSSVRRRFGPFVLLRNLDDAKMIEDLLNHLDLFGVVIGSDNSALADYVRNALTNSAHEVVSVERPKWRRLVFPHSAVGLATGARIERARAPSIAATHFDGPLISGYGRDLPDAI